MMRKIIAGLFLFCATLTMAQETSYREDVITYLDINGTTDQYENAINGLFDLLKRQYSHENIGDEVWSALRDEASGEVRKIKSLLVSAYRGTFEQDDIQNLIKFYQTPTGKQFLKDQTALTQEQQNEAAAFYNSPTGQKVLTKRQEISSRVSEVSEIWSRDLYRSMVDKLAEKGFMMKQ